VVAARLNRPRMVLSVLTRRMICRIYSTTYGGENPIFKNTIQSRSSILASARIKRRTRKTTKTPKAVSTATSRTLNGRGKNPNLPGRYQKIGIKIRIRSCSVSTIVIAATATNRAKASKPLSPIDVPREQGAHNTSCHHNGRGDPRILSRIVARIEHGSRSYLDSNSNRELLEDKGLQ